MKTLTKINNLLFKDKSIGVRISNCVLVALLALTAVPIISYARDQIFGEELICETYTVNNGSTNQTLNSKVLASNYWFYSEYIDESSGLLMKRDSIEKNMKASNKYGKLFVSHNDEFYIVERNNIVILKNCQ